MRTEVPYGPAMILGAWAAIILAGLGAFPIPT
jgi:prepilin signal peptidase PulO-like enzyme (type II secretory pathway)